MSSRKAWRSSASSSSWKAGSSKPMRRGQVAEDLRVGPRLAQRRDRGLVDQHVGVAVAGVDVQVLELRGGRQHVVGQVGRVGHEVLQHHGEQVLALEAGHHLGRLRRHRHRVAVVDDQRLHFRAESGRGLAQQGVADGAHVDGARRPAGAQLGALQRRVLERREPARARQQQPARAVAPGARQARQAARSARTALPPPRTRCMP